MKQTAQTNSSSNRAKMGMAQSSGKKGAKRPGIPPRTVIRLWIASGGRCEYEGCNKALWRDELTMTEINSGLVAHIVDVNNQTHRYDPILSPKLAKEFSNLMLLCHDHHRKIDGEEEKEHTVERLQAMKEKHERRIEMLTGIKEENKSHVLFYGANIGEQSPHLRFERAVWAMVPYRYPAESWAIELSLKNSARKDSDQQFWSIEQENLRANFDSQVRPRINSGSISHLSIFALAPIPLLMELGRLLTDIHQADCYGSRCFEAYQLHREPPDWCWQDHPENFKYLIEEPKTNKPHVALNLSLSASIDNSRIHAVLGDDIAIWKLTHPSPNNDFLKSREQLSMFRVAVRNLFNRIKSRHGRDTILHVFPAIPVSTAVDFGRVWMPKADLSLKLYDENRSRGGFVFALDFNNEPTN